MLRDDVSFWQSNNSCSGWYMVYGICDDAITCGWRVTIAGAAQMPAVIAVSKFHSILLFAVHYISIQFLDCCYFKSQDA